MLSFSKSLNEAARDPEEKCRVSQGTFRYCLEIADIHAKAKVTETFPRISSVCISCSSGFQFLQAFCAPQALYAKQAATAVFVRSCGNQCFVLLRGWSVGQILVELGFLVQR